MKQNKKKNVGDKESDIKEYLKTELLRKGRADGEIKESDLKIARSCRLRFFGGKPWRWEVGFSIKNGKKRDEYRALLAYPQPRIIGIIKQNLPFKGSEAMDLTYLAPPELIAKQRWGEYTSSYPEIECEDD